MAFRHKTYLTNEKWTKEDKRDKVSKRDRSNRSIILLFHNTGLRLAIINHKTWKVAKMLKLISTKDGNLKKGWIFYIIFKINIFVRPFLLPSVNELEQENLASRNEFKLNRIRCRSATVSWHQLKIFVVRNNQDVSVGSIFFNLFP